MATNFEIISNALSDVAVIVNAQSQSMYLGGMAQAGLKSMLWSANNAFESIERMNRQLSETRINRRKVSLGDQIKKTEVELADTLQGFGYLRNISRGELAEEFWTDIEGQLERVLIGGTDIAKLTATKSIEDQAAEIGMDVAEYKGMLADNGYIVDESPEIDDELDAKFEARLAALDAADGEVVDFSDRDTRLLLGSFARYLRQKIGKVQMLANNRSMGQQIRENSEGNKRIMLALIDQWETQAERISQVKESQGLELDPTSDINMH